MVTMSNELRSRVNISLPTRLVLEVDLEFIDHRTGKPAYGERSQLIGRLLQQWLDERKGTRATV